MHKLETIYKVVEEDLATTDIVDNDLCDSIVAMMVELMSAKNNAVQDTFHNNFIAMDKIRKVVALGLNTMQRLGFTRQYDNRIHKD